MTTPRHGFTELPTGQNASPESMNEAVRQLEQGANHFSVLDKDLTAPPGSPTDGAAYIVGASATGAWSGKDGKIAHYLSTAWSYITPKEGDYADVADEDALYRHDGAAWSVRASVSSSFSATLTASETLSAGNFVNIHASSGAKIRKANATDDTKPVDGFVAAGIASAASGVMTFPGQKLTGLSSLTAGARYYLDTTGGAITATAPSGSGNLVQEVGVALSTTELLFNPKPGITLA